MEDVHKKHLEKNKNINQTGMMIIKSEKSSHNTITTIPSMKSDIKTINQAFNHAPMHPCTHSPVHLYIYNNDNL